MSLYILAFQKIPSILIFSLKKLTFPLSEKDFAPPPLTLKGPGYFTNKKDGGGGHYGPHVYLGL